MICDECKNCYNYLVCENGCFGSTEPCEHLQSDDFELCLKIIDLHLTQVEIERAKGEY